MAIIKGLAYWAHVNELDTKYAPQWNIKLVFDKEEMLKLKALQIKPTVTTDEEGNPVFYKTFRRYLKNRSTGGGENLKPAVYDAALNEYTGEIGNGSEVLVKFKPFHWKNKHGQGVGADLEGIQIINLVEYNSGESEENMIESGIVEVQEDFQVIGESLPQVEAKVRKITELEKKEKEITGLSDDEF